MREHRLRPPSYSYELTVASSLNLRHQIRLNVAQRIKRFNQRTAAHYCFLKKRYTREGYAQGLEEAREEFRSICAKLAATYAEVANLAQDDGKKLAVLLAEQLLEVQLEQQPSSLMLWFNRAAELLRSSRSLTLLYHPRLSQTVRKLSPDLPANMTLQVSNNLGGSDFSVIGDSGGVECAWRAALDRLTSTAAAETPE